MSKIESVDVVAEIISKDEWMMQVLEAAENLNLPDWWIGAGFLRNKVWDYISGNESSKVRDVDLIYFDKNKNEAESDYTYEEKLNKQFPDAEWEVRNQARMHQKNGFEPFTSTEDGIAHWTETATAVAVRKEGSLLEFLFCYGPEDLYSMIAKPTVYMDTPDLLDLVRSRIEAKGWVKRWPDLTVVKQRSTKKPIHEKAAVEISIS